MPADAHVLAVGTRWWCVDSVDGFPQCSKWGQERAGVNVLFVQPRALVQCNEELARIRIWYVEVGHGELAAMIEPQSGVKLIRKIPTVHTLSPCMQDYESGHVRVEQLSVITTSFEFPNLNGPVKPIAESVKRTFASPSWIPCLNEQAFDDAVKNHFVAVILQVGGQWM